jgi:hypothetical protein
MMRRYSGAAVAVIVALGCLMLSGCEETASAKFEAKRLLSRFVRAVAEPIVSDLDEATFAMHEGEWQRAEKYLERFLITETDVEERWQAWQKLLEANERAGQDKRWINDYLETMLVEFRSNPERQRSILRRMAELQEAARDYDQAITSWMQLVSIPDTSADESLEIYKRLASLQMRAKRFQGAEDSLHECLSLPLSDEQKVDCMYSLAELGFLRDEQEESVSSIQHILEMSDIPPLVQARTVFLLADMREQQQRYPEALDLFESIRDIYPNQQAVDVHINYLKKRLKQ